MEAEIPASSLKAFYKALQCLARIGTDISFAARSDELELIGINASRSAYASFKFTQQFFDAYNVLLPPDGSPSQAFRCKVLSKPLVGIFKSRGPQPVHAVEKCVLRIEQAAEPMHAGRLDRDSSNMMSNVNGECRLVVQMTYKQGICKTHRLFYEVCDTLHSVYRKDECKNRWRVGAKVAADWIAHFARGLEEVSIWMSTSEVKVRSWAEGQFAGIGRSQIEAAVAETTRALQTELTVEPAEFDMYSVAGHHPTELTFGLREFKAVLQYAEAMAMPVSAYFDKAGDPLLLSVNSTRRSDDTGMYSMAPDDLTAEFAIATISNYIDAVSTPGSASSVRYNRTPQLNRAGKKPVHEVDDISQPSPSRSSVRTTGLRRHEETIYDVDVSIVPSPSPFVSSAHSSNAGLWANNNPALDRSDSLLNTPTPSASTMRRAATAGTGRSQIEQNLPAGPASQPLSDVSVQPTPVMNSPANNTRSYRLLQMPRPAAPPGVTDQENEDEEDEASRLAPPGKVQTRLPYKPTSANKDGPIELDSDTDMSGEDEDLDATPPPPSKRMKSLF
ncbi:hypothetical protein DL89DRAFT_269292 [Linderina pennispora]|uniref:Rad9-domain-containing protein n=1 Tax=Linderina pennispora TaxID=61395 RepID=A0A1Y1W2J1_9FUNG|nr:uncharacterized protein DL89DRAFT_269292 [Linderina pennispora]ORX67495.1 hypothetical protein DL89DRAFT_269292 [Linderina pennispora]